MQFRISILSRAVVVGLLLFASIATGLAEDRPQADARRDALREWQNLANGRTEFEIADPALVPKPLALAIEQSDCRYKDDIQHRPIRIVRVEKQRLAIVFCRFSVVGSDMVFDLDNLQKPKVLAFPHPASKGGFGTTDLPGAITWKKEAGVLEAEPVTDLACTWRTRYTYRLDKSFAGITFVIVRIQVNKNECRQDEWLTVWEASPWPEQPKSP